jgi:hypothetical protein
MTDRASTDPMGASEGDAPDARVPGLGEMLDTSPRARRFYFERLARLTTAERLALMDAGSRMIRSLAEAAIRREHPGVTPQELRARLAVRFYGRELAQRVLGPVPADAR